MVKTAGGSQVPTHNLGPCILTCMEQIKSIIKKWILIYVFLSGLDPMVSQIFSYPLKLFLATWMEAIKWYKLSLTKSGNEISKGLWQHQRTGCVRDLLGRGVNWVESDWNGRFFILMPLVSNLLNKQVRYIPNLHPTWVTNSSTINRLFLFVS